MTPREWIISSIRKIEAEFNRSADTHLIPIDLPGFPDQHFYFKDESNHPTGSLKHRLARSLFLYALSNGWLHPDRPVIEASSGSTAVSEAYFAQLLNLPFIAVIPAATSPEKITAIQLMGGRCHFVERACELDTEARRLANQTGGHFMDQFTYAERAADRRESDTIAESIFRQMAQEQCPIPAWIVCSPGTGGTAVTLGRYVRAHGYHSRILCADPEVSVFYQGYCAALSGQQNWRDFFDARSSKVEGIGRSRVETSFLPHCIDAMVKVPDPLSFAAMRYLSARLGRKVGGSTGTNFVGVLKVATRMRDQGQSGAIVTIICDRGERYIHTYYDSQWYIRQGIDIRTADAQIEAVMQGGRLPDLACTIEEEDYACCL